MTLRVRILGAAAGGGLPQWNCGCTNCTAARRGTIAAASQSGACVSGDGATWALLNASPDLRVQMAATPQLHPTGPRASPLSAVLITNGDIDHVAGLLHLRERQPFTLFATAGIHATLSANPVFGVLDPALVARVEITLGTAFPLCPGVEATLFPVPGKVPLYLEGAEVVMDLEGEQTVGVTLTAAGTRAHYVPGCARMTPALAARLAGADLILFDGTLYRDDEMIALGLGTKTGRRMGHMPIAGADGSLAAFAAIPAGRRVYVHLNNTNPVLDPASSAHAAVTDAGWEVARDGMEIVL